MNEALLFHLTGTLTGPDLRPAAGAALRPALFARFRDLARLRYRFPLVLGESDDASFARPLSLVVDELLRELAPRGPAGERLRRSVLRAEREIRALLAGGAAGTLSQMWDAAADRLALRRGEPARADLSAARAALRTDGELLDCDATMPARFVGHAWRLARGRTAHAMRERIDALIARLTDLVRADLLRSAAGQRAEVLRAGIGPIHRDLFDLELMAHLLASPAGASGMSERRRRRIEAAVAALRAQTLFTPDRAPRAFRAVDEALAAFRDGLPAVAALARAIAVAELEVDGYDVDAAHDAWIASIDERALGPEELGWSPDRLVVLGPSAATPAGRAEVLGALGSGYPLKVLVEVGDALGPGGHLASAAMGLGDVLVVQASAAALPEMAPSVHAAVASSGPALIAVFTGAVRDDVPPYLVAAAATESRAFPSFAYDPSAGPGWADRFTLGEHPQPERAWPTHRLAYADDALQRVTVELPFTPADLALCDPRWASSFAVAAPERWGELATLAERPDAASGPGGDALPATYAVDPDDRLRMVVVDERLLRAATRAAGAWERLRELDALKRPPVAAPPVETAPSATAAAAPAAEPAVAAPAPSAEVERSPDEPSIETARCSSCNECTLLNARMFRYNENKQAYIADASAGTYRDLVEAAERCQVAIIHPGKPRDANEPGLDELLERAKAFA